MVLVCVVVESQNGIVMKLEIEGGAELEIMLTRLPENVCVAVAWVLSADTVGAVGVSVGVSELNGVGSGTTSLSVDAKTGSSVG
jgi:hypothetical protein